MNNWKMLDKKYYYDGSDLGCVYKKEETTFRVWSPTAKKVTLNLYGQGNGDCLLETIPMMMDVNGTWYTVVQKDLKGMYYTYTIDRETSSQEVIDVYAKVAGVNGKRAMVLDFAETNPAGWEQDHGPALKEKTDAVLYELHLRDVSADSTSGIKNKYLFGGLAEEGTKSPDGLATGLDHIKEMGVTHVHLLPLHDFGSVDEEHPEKKQFNWGYDPVNYSVLEGSYSSDPYHGEVRVKEFKQLVKKLHDNGIGVVMDVVYNHTYHTEDSVFEKTLPGYYYRMRKDGTFANGSACGNETASEHKMMRKFMVDSLCFWAKEYHIDGFRFDLMGIHDVDRMNEIARELKKIKSDIILYGEGWAAEAPLLEPERLAMKVNAKKVPDYGMFNDNIRDAVKGHVFAVEAKGFVNGKANMEEELKFAVVGSTHHSQALKGKEKDWARTAAQSINYISAHDDLTLWDKLALTNPEDDEQTRKQMNCLAAAIVFTAQGIPFIQAGEEMLRTKPGTEPGKKFTSNSYNAPDEINSLKWNRKREYADVVAYYKGLIAFRKEHSMLRMVEPSEIEKRLQFMDMPKNMVGYVIDGKGLEDSLDEVCVIYNANRTSQQVKIPEGCWKVYINGTNAGTKAIEEKKGSVIIVDPLSAIVLGR